MTLEPSAAKMQQGITDAKRATNLGLRIAVHGPPATAEEVSYADLVDYTLKMIETLEDHLVLLTALSSLMADRLAQLEAKTA